MRIDVSARRRRDFRSAAGIAALLLCASACHLRCGRYCSADSEATLRSAANDEECAVLTVQDTKLSSLSGLEEIAHPLDLNVFGNDELVDVSAVLSIAGTVALENNASLTTADLGLVGALRIDDEIDSNFPEHHLEDLSLISGNVLQGQAAATDVSINHSSESGSSLRTIAVGCADDCLPLSLRVRAPHGLNGS